jgi:diguanylate cyclase (GGDEF)-like protein
MVRLNKKNLTGEVSEVKKKVHNSDDKKSKNENSEIEKFSLFVLKTVIDDGVPPTPNNFQIYFEKLLENKPFAFRKKMKEYQDSDDIDADEYRAKMEREIKEGFAQIKGIVKVVSTIYKNLNVMKQIVKKRLNELKANSSQLSVDNTLTRLNDDINKLSTLTERQMGTLKDHYAKTVEILKDVEDKAIFDSKYGVYNKKHFLTSLKKELETVKQYNHNSSVVMVKIKNEVLDKIVASGQREMLTRNIAKLLMKTSRRSDIVAHYGSGIFAILMKHTDLNSAKKACERIADLIYSTSFFIDGMEIEIDVELGIMPIDTNLEVEEIVSAVLDILPKTGKDTDVYLVGEFDGR